MSPPAVCFPDTSGTNCSRMWWQELLSILRINTFKGTKISSLLPTVKQLLSQVWLWPFWPCVLAVFPQIMRPKNTLIPSFYSGMNYGEFYNKGPCEWVWFTEALPHNTELCIVVFLAQQPFCPHVDNHGSAEKNIKETQQKKDFPLFITTFFILWQGFDKLICLAN